MTKVHIEKVLSIQGFNSAHVVIRYLDDEKIDIWGYMGYDLQLKDMAPFLYSSIIILTNELRHQLFCKTLMLTRKYVMRQAHGPKIKGQLNLLQKSLEKKVILIIILTDELSYQVL